MKKTQKKYEKNYLEETMLRCCVKDIRDGVQYKDDEIIKMMWHVYLVIFSRYKNKIADNYEEHGFNGRYIREMTIEDFEKVMKSK